LPPSGCRHLPPQAEEGFQADASHFPFPRNAEEGFQVDASDFPFPRKRGKVPKADGGAPRENATVRSASNVTCHWWAMSWRVKRVD